MSPKLVVSATKLPDKIQETYSHVADEVETRLIIALQARWTTAIAEQPDHPHDSSWRQVS